MIRTGSVSTTKFNIFPMLFMVAAVFVVVLAPQGARAETQMCPQQYQRFKTCVDSNFVAGRAQTCTKCMNNAIPQKNNNNNQATSCSVFGNVCANVQACSNSCETCTVEALDLATCYVQEQYDCTPKCSAFSDVKSCVTKVQSSCNCALVRKGDSACVEKAITNDCKLPENLNQAAVYTIDVKTSWQSFCKSSSL